MKNAFLYHCWVHACYSQVMATFIFDEQFGVHESFAEFHPALGHSVYNTTSNIYYNDLLRYG